MKWKKALERASIVLLFLFTFSSLTYATWDINPRWNIDPRWIIGVVEAATYPSHTFARDGNCLMYGGIQLKPNDIHTYIPQFDGRYQNITLDSGTLTLSKGPCAYNINCSTNDNVTINIYNWVYPDKTRFQTIAENETALSFTVNSRNRGEPRDISGVSSWSYDEETTIVSLTTANYSMVIIAWLSPGAAQLEWYLNRIPMWLGITGMICLVLSPITLVYFMKQDDYTNACIAMLFLFILGIGLLVGWLW